MQVFVVVAMDADIGTNSEVIYTILSQEPAEHFVIDGEMFVTFVSWLWSLSHFVHW